MKLTLFKLSSHRKCTENKWKFSNCKILDACDISHNKDDENCDNKKK